ncbi:putative glutathione S-transferase BZ2 [Tetrabaena socialis]|uniref:Putative glutathione S-transferase BZ2 n=1 Tax=Tetrabaena socialis TaxID=47790 RepID=A0A2J7ZZR3_9CHLO|nr:putative glutathione S-transferase BZ2 [Tetrabaena socialis]|eukprot:PNH05761.1 putative glutathione S-transferase BZ2 [Tetrabaena socialis]
MQIAKVQPGRGHRGARLAPRALPRLLDIRLALYDDPHSEYSAKVKVALRGKGIDFDLLSLPCGSSRSPEYLALNPLGKIPALVVTNIRTGAKDVVVESEVILEYLEDLQLPGAAPLLPVEPLARSKARLISRYHDLYLEPALRRLYSQVAPATRDDGVVAEAVPALLARLSELQSLLPDLPGRAFALTSEAEGLGFADCGYPGALLYAELILAALGVPGGLEYERLGLGRIGRWREALWGHEGVRAVLAELRPAAEEWVEGKLRS